MRASENPYKGILSELKTYLTPLDAVSTRLNTAEMKMRESLGKYAMDFKGYTQLLSESDKFSSLYKGRSDLQGQVELIGREYTQKEMAALTKRGPIMMGQDDDGRMRSGGGPNFTWEAKQESKLQSDVDNFHKSLIQQKKNFNSAQVDIKHWEDSMASDEMSKEYARRSSLNRQVAAEAALPGWAKGVLEVERPLLGSIYKIPVVGNMINSMIHISGESLGVDSSELFHTQNPKSPLQDLWDSILDLVVAFLDSLGFDLTREDLNTIFIIVIITSLFVFVVLPATKEIKSFLT